MNGPVPLDLKTMAEEIRRLYGAGSSGAGNLIRDYFEKKLGHLVPDEKVALVKKLTQSFCSDGADVTTAASRDVLTQICSLLLGRKICADDLSSSDMLNRLADSLNTIFDTLNQLVASIHATLKGGGGGEETIRQVIGVHLGGRDQTESLEIYLGQIKEAFWVAQEAFKHAADTLFKQVLDELNPERMKEQQAKGFKFGSTRKAESFDTFEEKYGKIKQWFESGRFSEEFLREFERNAQRLSSR